MQNNIWKYLLIGIFLIIAAWFGKFIGTSGSFVLPLVLVLGLYIVFITFIKPEIAMILLIMSMLLSPELNVMSGGGKEVVLRVDDVLLVLIFIVWFVKIALKKDLGITKKSPINALLIAYSVSIAISTGLAMMRGGINPLTGFFFVLKYFQYFMLFFMVMNHINSERDLKTYLIAAIATCIIVTIYEYTQMGTGERLSLPFESPIGTNPEEASIEPATLGGYYLLVLGVAFGFISEYSWRATFPLWGLIVFIITPFVLTLSRTSYVGLIILLISYIFLARSKRFVYTIFTAMVFLSFLWYSKDIKEKVTERVMYTVNLIERDSFTLKIGNREVTFEPSTAQRIRNYIEIATYRFPKHPFFGWGATGVGLVDAQFPRVLGEAGAVGFTIFLMLIVTIFREAYRVYHTVDKPLARALSLGLVFVFIGIIFQSVGANTFIIVRIMEPFWLLVACVMSLPYIYKKEEIQSA